MTPSHASSAARVSVIVPTYNRAAVIGEALEAVIGQTYPVHEIIVVDDASTDNTCDIVEQFGEPRMQLLRRAENGGGGAARHDGVLAASGDFIAFLDSDDIWAADKLERQVEHLFATVDAEDLPQVLSYSNLREISDEGFGRLRNVRGRDEGEPIGDYIFLSQQTIQTSTLLVAASLAKRVQFAPDLRRHQDWDFVMRAEQAGAVFVYFDAPLVFLRQWAPEGRVSRQRNVEPSQYWLAKTGATLLSERARNVFIATEIMPRIFSDHPLRASAWIANALVKGDLPRKRGLRFLARLILTEESLARWKRRLPKAASGSPHRDYNPG